MSPRPDGAVTAEQVPPVDPASQGGDAEINETWTQTEPGTLQTIPFSMRERVARKLSETLTGRWRLRRLPLRLERGILSVNFDDFPRTAWTEGGAVLAELGVNATYFATGGLHGCRFDGTEEFGIADLEAAHAAGHELGSHTYDHLAATRCTPGAFLASVVRNQRFLAAVLPGCRIESFCYPYGLATVHLRARFPGLFTSHRGTIQASNGPVLDTSLLCAFGLERWRFERWRLTRIGDLEAYFGPIFAAAAREKRWVIVFTHDVRDRPSPMATPGQLHQLVALALRHGLAIATNAEVMRQQRQAEAARPQATEAKGSLV